jgi:hypothetical protein
LRSANESLAIKRCIWQWGLLSPEHRKPTTQGELAKALGVRRSYVGKVLKRLPFDAPVELLEASPVTPPHVISMRQRHEQFRRQQDEQARLEAECWAEAWREERARQQGYWPEPNTDNGLDAYPSHPRREPRNKDDEELHRMVGDDPELRELARTMFPWKKF